MLPDLRFVFGALMVIAITGMVGVGLFVSARLFHQAKVGPLEARRNFAFTDTVEWNQFYDAGSVRRFVGLAPQGERREMSPLPPEHAAERAARVPQAVALAPAVELPKQSGGTDLAPLSTPPVAVTPIDHAPPTKTAAAVAVPALPDQAREIPAEHAATAGMDTAADVRPGPTQTAVVPVAPVLLQSEPVTAAERLATPALPLAASGPATDAVAHAIEAENLADRHSSDTAATGDRDANERTALTVGVATAPAVAAATAPPQTSKAPLAAAVPHPPAAPTKPAAPAPAVRARVKRPAPDDDDVDEPRRSAAPSRPRAPASAAQTATRAHAPQWNGPQQRSDLRPFPSGQPVFGPHFPYASPNQSQPHFGPHFPYATPQASRQSAARAPQYRAPSPTHAQPSYDSRQYTPRSYARQPAARQLRYDPVYGWR